MRGTTIMRICGVCKENFCKNPGHIRLNRTYAGKGSGKTVVGRRPAKDEYGRPTGKFEYFYPARADAELPKSYERVEFDSIRDLEAHGKETGAWNEQVSYSSAAIDSLVPTDDGSSDPDLDPITALCDDDPGSDDGVLG